MNLLINADTIIAVFALIVSIFSLWHNWPDKHNLNIFLQIEEILSLDRQNPEMKGRMVKIAQVLLTNDGNKGIIISQCKYTTKQEGVCDLGIYDFFTGNIVLPKLIEPASTHVLNIVPSSSFQEINSITLIDNKDKEYKITKEQIDDLNHRIGILKALEQS